MRRLLILRPEPGATATAKRARAMGMDAIVRPLFAVETTAWAAPDPDLFDALLLTSANAVRLAGPDLARLSALPVLAVGAATADAARDAGLRVETVGDGGVDALLRTVPGSRRLLHLGGRETLAPAVSAHVITRIAVYASTACPIADLPVSGMVILVHSPRAGQQLADLVSGAARAEAAVAAISPAAVAACGAGWDTCEAAGTTDDSALLALAARLCHKPA